jgi:hypothetical protein
VVSGKGGLCDQMLISLISVGQRLSLSLSTLELAKAWTESGLGYRAADLTTSTTSTATVSHTMQ